MTGRGTDQGKPAMRFQARVQRVDETGPPGEVRAKRRDIKLRRQKSRITISCLPTHNKRMRALVKPPTHLISKPLREKRNNDITKPFFRLYAWSGV